MLRTYKAILQGNHLEWNGEAPTHLTPDQAVLVHVTLLEEPPRPSTGEQPGAPMAAILEQLATLQALSDLTDPAAWERELRQDRPLPDRNPGC